MEAKGYYQTPKDIVQRMVKRLFSIHTPKSTHTLLDPGCGRGDFIDGVIDFCKKQGFSLPQILGIELDSELASFTESKYKNEHQVTILNQDYLTHGIGKFNFIIGNPPYVSIDQLSEEEKQKYRPLFKTAVARFDLYMLFFEKALEQLKSNGTLVFITPEKFVYVETASRLREILSQYQIVSIEFLDESSFEEVLAYPTVTTIYGSEYIKPTSIKRRNGSQIKIVLPKDISSWQPFLNGSNIVHSDYFLSDISSRISCGVATGADKIFVIRNDELSTDLKAFAHPTVSGRDLIHGEELQTTEYSMLVPYDRNGSLLDIHELASFATYLKQPKIRERLERRTCVKRKPWYAFHENPPMKDIFKPKIICKDISSRPDFWLDRTGIFLPRHSVYYIIPKDESMLDEIFFYLKSEQASEWLTNNCQRASNGFIRMQSTILKKLPIPEDLCFELGGIQDDLSAYIQ